MSVVGSARPGDGRHVERLADIALSRQPSYRVPGVLKAAVDRSNGEFPLKPFGRARVLVAEREPGGPVCGLVVVLSPVRLMKDHAAEGWPVQRALSVAVAEVDLLAVDENLRGQGLGTALLAEAEAWLEGRGCRVAITKIARGDYTVMRWYRRRGYLAAAQRENCRLLLPGIDTTIDDCGENFQLALKGLGGATVVRKRQTAHSHLVVSEPRSPVPVGPS
jgi:GNAT superfamily N-acetyltransferase